VSDNFARVVVDTNVLLSAALSPNGAAAQLVDRLLADGRLLFSEVTFAELETRIWKPKFDRYLSIERRKQILHELNASAMWVDVPAQIANQLFSRDINDDAFVHVALAASATRLITGDDDLLCLHPINALHILTPRAALDEINARGGG